MANNLIRKSSLNFKDKMKDNLISPEFVEKLKGRNDIVSIISKYVHLEKKGKNFWGCCPFHHEKTPSFCVNEYEQFYHCFGCGESGDVITFLRKFQNMDYKEAIEFLANNAGMEVPQFKEDENYRKIKLTKDKNIEILNLTRQFYKENIYKPNAKLAQDYIKKRKLTRKELESFELGYSPDFYSLINFLTEKKFSLEQMKNAGVIDFSTKNKKPYDFLAERLIFPIVNSFGDCIGFSGRDLKNTGIMKYKNTSATLTFDKSKTVYAINLIKEKKQKESISSLILVEGQFDVITMHKYGFDTAVACLGTAITKEHTREIKHYTDNIILCLDGDDAGQKATIRAIENLDNSGLNVKIAVLPSGYDPDDFLTKFGSEKMQKLLDNAISPVSFKILYIKKKYDINKPEEKAKFVKSVLLELKKIIDNAEQDIYLIELKNIVNIPLDILRRNLDSIATPEQKNLASEKPEEKPLEIKQDASIEAMKFILASMLWDKPYSHTDIDFNEFFINPSLNQLYNIILSKRKEKKKTQITTLFEIFDMETEPIINQIINYNFEIITNAEKYFAECVWNIVENDLKFKITEKGKQYTEEKDLERRKNLLIEINEMNNTLRNKNLGGLKKL